MSGAPSGSPGGSQDQEFMVRIPPRNEQKKYHIMKFNASLNIDPAKWTQVEPYYAKFNLATSSLVRDTDIWDNFSF